MAILLNVVAPVFGVMLLGFLAVRIRVLDTAAVKGLVRFVFNFALPALLFRSLARTVLPPDMEWGFLLAFYGGSFFAYFLGMALGRFPFRRPLDQQAIFGMSAGFSNTVLLGIPVIITAFGPEASLPIFLIIAFHGPTLMPLTTALIQIGRGTELSLGAQVQGVVMELVRNPIIMALLLGFLVNLANISLPASADRFLELLGAAAVPCALFAMGASLARYPLTGDVPPALVLVLVKLVIHPMVVWILAVPVLGLEGLWVAVAVTMAAMPSGINVYLFGARYDAAPGVAARSVLLSTVFSVATLSTLLYLFGAG
ncbi:AEC family transporter [Gemmatimonadota bacterium]